METSSTFQFSNKSSNLLRKFVRCFAFVKSDKVEDDKCSIIQTTK